MARGWARHRHISLVRASERQRGSVQPRPAWPGNAITTDQYAPAVPAGGEHRQPPGTRRIVKEWPDEPVVTRRLQRPRDDLLLEVRRTGDGDPETTFDQADGPFTEYRRDADPAQTPTVIHGGERRRTIGSSIPWFGWLFALPVRAALARRGAALTHVDHERDGVAPTPWWAPPDRLDPRAITVLGLLAAASMSSAFVNTLFTQTVNFAADDFGVGDTGIGIAGAIVRGRDPARPPAGGDGRPHRSPARASPGSPSPHP